MRRLHLVYAHGSSISTPDAVGRNLAQQLANHFEVLLYDWRSRAKIIPRTGDVLLGHPHPVPGTILRRSWKQAGWAGRFLLSPYNADLSQVAYLDPFVRTCDAYFAITGTPWAEALPFGPFAHWSPRLIPVDLAVDRGDFPRVKRSFAPQGKRKFLYIGNTLPCKNTEYLTAIAAATRDVHFGWIGDGRPIHLLEAHGRLDMSLSDARELIARYDFLITVGRADANPTTVLEAMAWGLIPVATRTSGYDEASGVIELPLDDLDGAVKVVRRLQALETLTLEQYRARCDQLLESRYSWERFASVISARLTSEAPTSESIKVPPYHALIRAAAVGFVARWVHREARAAIGNLRRDVRPRAG